MAIRQQNIIFPDSTAVIIVAAGMGLRLGGDVVKSFRMLGDKPLFIFAMEVFQALSAIRGIVLVAPQDHLEKAQDWVERYSITKTIAVVPGGLERSDSVQNGLKVVPADVRWVAIHDGARPFITSDLFYRVLEAASEHGAAIPGVALADTIKEISDNKVINTIPRHQLRGAQTPQIFEYQRLKLAYTKASDTGFYATDDADVVQKFTEGKVAVVDGEAINFKITTPADWQRALDIVNKHRD